MSDFFDQGGVGMVWPGPVHTRPAGIRDEWGVKFYGNDVVIMAYDNEGAALRTLEHHRKDLRKMNIPEEYWPILVSRTVETVVGSWRHRNE